MNILCSLGLHSLKKRPIKIGKEKIVDWNMENIDRELTYTHGLFECSKCERKVWKPISFDQYRKFRKSNLCREIEGDDRDIGLIMREESLKYKWRMDEEFEVEPKSEVENK